MQDHFPFMPAVTDFPDGYVRIFHAQAVQSGLDRGIHELSSMVSSTPRHCTTASAGRHFSQMRIYRPENVVKTNGGVMTLKFFQPTPVPYCG